VKAKILGEADHRVEGAPVVVKVEAVGLIRLLTSFPEAGLNILPSFAGQSQRALRWSWFISQKHLFGLGSYDRQYRRVLNCIALDRVAFSCDDGKHVDE
jgi:hypothetical protein